MILDHSFQAIELVVTKIGRQGNKCGHQRLVVLTDKVAGDIADQLSDQIFPIYAGAINKGMPLLAATEQLLFVQTVQCALNRIQ